MTDEPSPGREPATVPPGGAADLRRGARPWVTYAIMVLCIGIFLGVNSSKEPESWENLSKFGAPPSFSIWSGAWWALISSAFVHVALWHLAFNLYWLWALGSDMERAIGSLRYGAFVIGSAFVSSGCELAMSAETGIGASGVLYAIFGFMWLAKDRYPQFKEMVDSRTIAIFTIWLLGCIAATLAKVVPIANAAHVSGLAFGAGVAAAFVLRWRRRMVLAGIGVLTAIALVSLFWSPWPVNWLSFQAYKAHEAQDYPLALERYTQVITRDPTNVWAYENRSAVHAGLGNTEKAAADFQKARELDPSIQAGQ
jgi:rhomboid protease GluP